MPVVYRYTCRVLELTTASGGREDRSAGLDSFQTKPEIALDQIRRARE